MTLGGLALAVGILVDDATVEIENIERQLHLGKNPRRAILDGAAEIAIPALVSTLCICIVFVPMFFLDGVARYLFVPLAEAVVFAMLASYVLSRTLVPTLAMYLMGRRAHDGAAATKPGRLRRAHLAFDRGFERVRAGYTVVLAHLLRRKLAFGAAFLALSLASLALYPLLGRDFFPSVDAGQNALISLSSSFQTAPTYWLNPANGNVLSVSVQTRQHEIDSLDALLRIPVNGPGGKATQTPQSLGDLVRVKRRRRRRARRAAAGDAGARLRPRRRGAGRRPDAGAAAAGPAARTDTALLTGQQSRSSTAGQPTAAGAALGAGMRPETASIVRHLHSISTYRHAFQHIATPRDGTPRDWHTSCVLPR